MYCLRMYARASKTFHCPRRENVAKPSRSRVVLRSDQRIVRTTIREFPVKVYPRRRAPQTREKLSKSDNASMVRGNGGAAVSFRVVNCFFFFIVQLSRRHARAHEHVCSYCLLRNIRVMHIT